MGWLSRCTASSSSAPTCPRGRIGWSGQGGGWHMPSMQVVPPLHLASTVHEQPVVFVDPSLLIGLDARVRRKGQTGKFVGPAQRASGGQRAWVQLVTVLQRFIRLIRITSNMMVALLHKVHHI